LVRFGAALLSFGAGCHGGSASSTLADGAANDAAVTSEAGFPADTSSTPAVWPATSRLFQPIDNMEIDRAGFPTTPPGSSGFFYRFGLGNWFVSSPNGLVGDALITNLEPRRGDSQRACHLTGTGQAGGLDLWAQLDHPRFLPIDLRAYAGISFWARMSGAAGRVTVAINDTNHNSVFEADARRTPLLVRTVTVGDWQRFILLFDDFERTLATPPDKAPIDASRVFSFHFIAGRDGRPFDLWIDDLELLCRGVCP
jgi:hypothetical protein